MDDDSIKPITNQGFFTYVFKLSRFKQEDLMNIVQYTLLSIAPVILFVYFTKKYFPTVHQDDSSLYMFVVTVIHLLFMMIGIFFIDRIINYIPTYSGKYYETINLTTVVLIFVLFMLLDESGFKDRTTVMLERFDKWFFIDDALIQKFGGEVRPFNLKIDDISPNRNSGKKNNKKGNAANTGNAPRAEGMTQKHTPPQPIPVEGPVAQQPMTQMYMGGGGGGRGQQGGGGGGGGYDQGQQGGYGGGGGYGGDDMLGGGMPEPIAANAALGGGGFGSAW
jgi:uncharacterized membrane protein YgcG